MVGGRHVAPSARILGDTRWLRETGLEHHVHLLRRLEKEVADGDVVDDLVATSKPPRGPLPLGELPGEVPQPNRIALVSDVEGAGVELGSRRPVQDLPADGVVPRAKLATGTERFSRSQVPTRTSIWFSSATPGRQQVSRVATRCGAPDIVAGIGGSTTPGVVTFLRTTRGGR